MDPDRKLTIVRAPRTSLKFQFYIGVARTLIELKPSGEPWKARGGFLGGADLLLLRREEGGGCQLQPEGVRCQLSAVEMGQKAALQDLCPAPHGCRVVREGSDHTVFSLLNLLYQSPVVCSLDSAPHSRQLRKYMNFINDSCLVQ